MRLEYTSASDADSVWAACRTPPSPVSLTDAAAGLTPSRGCGANIADFDGETSGPGAAEGCRPEATSSAVCRSTDRRPPNRLLNQTGAGTTGLGNSSSPSLNDSRIPDMDAGRPAPAPRGSTLVLRTTVPPFSGGAAAAAAFGSREEETAAAGSDTFSHSSRLTSGETGETSATGGGTRCMPANRSLGTAGTRKAAEGITGSVD